MIETSVMKELSFSKFNYLQNPSSRDINKEKAVVKISINFKHSSSTTSIKLQLKIQHGFASSNYLKTFIKTWFLWYIQLFMCLVSYEQTPFWTKIRFRKDCPKKNTHLLFLLIFLALVHYHNLNKNGQTIRIKYSMFV